MTKNKKLMMVNKLIKKKKKVITKMILAQILMNKMKKNK